LRQAGKVFFGILEIDKKFFSGNKRFKIPSSLDPASSFIILLELFWIPAFAGMTGAYTQSSFRRKPESSDCYPD
jgi:hypothetical protein